MNPSVAVVPSAALAKIDDAPVDATEIAIDATDVTVTNPCLLTLNLEVPPSCRSTRFDAPSLAVSVTLTNTAVCAVVDVFHVTARLTIGNCEEPVSVPPETAIAVPLTPEPCETVMPVVLAAWLTVTAFVTTDRLVITPN